MAKKRKVMADPIPPISYKNLYKSLLQEACRKGSFKDPVYVIVKEGPDHAPLFHASVSINTDIFKSEVPKSTRRGAEQNCAKIALPKLYGTDMQHLNLARLVTEAGLCKSMLQEYTQRVGLPLPTYQLEEKLLAGMKPLKIAKVQVGDMIYEGPAAKNKREAHRFVAMYACAQIMSKFTAKVRANGVIGPQTMS